MYKHRKLGVRFRHQSFLSVDSRFERRLLYPPARPEVVATKEDAIAQPDTTDTCAGSATVKGRSGRSIRGRGGGWREGREGAGSGSKRCTVRFRCGDIVATPPAPPSMAPASPAEDAEKKSRRENVTAAEQQGRSCWQDADVVFACSTCFNESLMRQVRASTSH
jgi:hypothetical protein